MELSNEEIKTLKIAVKSMLERCAYQLDHNKKLTNREAREYAAQEKYCIQIINKLK